MTCRSAAGQQHVAFRVSRFDKFDPQFLVMEGQAIWAGLNIVHSPRQILMQLDYLV